MTRLKIFAAALLGLASVLIVRLNRSTIAAEQLQVPAGKDPAYLEDSALLEKAVSCPIAVAESKGIVLLVHGSGMTPQINWDHTLLHPLVRNGYQPYYLEVPYRLFRDIQVTAEYVSSAVKKLSHDHGQDVSIISWSAGSLATQWTLVFYPETRAKVKRHIAIGASYRGSWSMVPLFYFNLYSEAVVQQLPWSKLIATLTKFGGGNAVVPTTNIGSSTDQIVQPGFYGEGWERVGYRDAWRLNGPLARNIDVFKVCARMSLSKWRFPRFFTHDSLLWEAASHAVVFDALANNDDCLGTAAAIDSAVCTGGPAKDIPSGSEKHHAAIMPELFKYAPTQPVAGWPELALREYTEGSTYMEASA